MQFATSIIAVYIFFGYIAVGVAFLVFSLLGIWRSIVLLISKNRDPQIVLHLTRPDKIGQAVSYLKAQQTGLWHVAPDGSELERLAPHREPRYDREEIRACVETMSAYDRDWNDRFAREGIEPLRISYDDLAIDPIETLHHILDHLGLGQAATDGVTPGVRKLADSTNREWADRYLSGR